MARYVDQLNFAAFLAEEIYRRGSGDQPLDLNDFRINGESQAPIAIQNSFSGFQSDLRVQYEQSGYQYTDNGFMGRIVRSGDTYYVVFRGSDSSESFFNNFTKAANSGFDQYASDPSRLTDIGDWTNNVNLGQGDHIENSQMMDALRLTREAIQLAGDDTSKVVVVGQSLGGGLSGLVSAILDVKGYAFAPAPYLNSLETYAELASLQDLGFTLSTNTYYDNGTPPALVTLPSFLNSNESQKKKYFEINGYSISDYDIYFDNAMEFVDTYKDNLKNNVNKHTLEGEALNYGLGSFSWMVGANHFATDSSRTFSYDVGFELNHLSDIWSNSPITLHGMSLHGLVIATTGMGSKSFQEILKSNSSLRYGLLENSNISGPVEGNRLDPHGSGFGGSGLNSGGSNSAILFRALWKEIDYGEFYYNFYDKFSIKLSNGAVSSGIDASALTPNSLHYAFTQLGLQIVRDGISRTGVTTDPVFSQAAWNVFGSRSDYAFIDINTISVPQGPNIRPYGSKEIDQVFLEILTNVTSATAASTLLGVTKSGLDDSSQKLDWEIAIANSQGSTWYMAEAVNAARGHIAFGGAYTDFIQASTEKDFIYAGAGDDIISMTGGSDVVIGGSGRDLLSYLNAPVPVSGPLTASLVGASIFQVEDIIGSQGAQNHLTGDTNNNLLVGGKLDDVFWTGGGSDIIVGGYGIDRVHFNYSFSQMTFGERMSPGSTVFSFSVANGPTTYVREVEEFVDSASTVWSLSDLMAARQISSGPFTVIQSSAQEESSAGTVFGIVDVNLSGIYVGPYERIAYYLANSDYLDMEQSSGRLTFRLKSGVNTDLDDSTLFSDPVMKVDVAVVKEVQNSAGQWVEMPPMNIGQVKFRIEDTYDNGISGIALAPPNVITGHVDSIREDTLPPAAGIDDILFFDPSYKHGYAMTGNRIDMIRVMADRSDRDDVVTARLTNDSDGYFKLVKYQNDEIGSNGLIYKRVTWGIVLAKEGLTAFSDPRTVTVEMTDGTNTVTRDISIQIQNVNEKPTDISFTPTPAALVTTPSSTLLIKHGLSFPSYAMAVKESPIGQGLVKLSAVDPDLHLDTHTYSIVGTPQINAFSIVGDEIVLNRNLTATEKEMIYGLTIEAKDSGNLTVQKVIYLAVDEPDNGLVGTNGNDVTTATAPAQSVVGREGKDTHGYQNAPGPIGIDAGAMRGTSGWANGAYYYSVEKIVGSDFPDQFRASPNSIGIFEIDGGGGQDTLDFGSLTFGITVNLASGSVNYAGRTLLFTSIESVVGTSYADQLYGILGMSNFLSGGAGNDTLYAGADGDFVFGGDGIDTVNYTFATGPMTINLAAGSAKLTNGTLTDLLLSVENATGSSFDDLLIAGPGPNVLQGGFGNDVYDQVDLGDTIIEIVVPPGFPLPPGWNPGIDTIRTIATSWTLGAGIENLTGLNTGNSTLKGNELDNVIIGNSGSDTLYGYAGNDSLYGGGGGDYLIGGDGDDFLDGGAGNDIIDGGNGNDTVSYLTRGAVTVNLATGSATLAGETDFLSSIENVIGSAFADTIAGTSGANRIRSGGGDDVIDAGAGNDIVEIDGGAVQVTLGAGDDIVLLTRGSSVTAHHITIVDFVTGEDKIHLEDGAFVPTVPYLFQDDVNGNAYLEIQDYGVVTFLGRTAASMSTGDLILV